MNILTRIILKVKWIFSFLNTRGTHGTFNFQFGYVVITESPETETVHETRRPYCLLRCPRPCQGREYIPRSPPGVDIACVPLQIWMLLYSSLSLGFLWPAYSHEVQPPRGNSMVREGVQQQVISWGNKGTKYKLSEKTCLCSEAGTVSGLLRTHIQTGNSRFHGFLLCSGNWKSISLSMWS